MDPRNSISNNHGNKGIIIGSVSGAAKVTNNVSDGDMYINNGRPTYNYEQNINGNQTAQNGGNIQNIQGGNVNTEPNKHDGGSDDADPDFEQNIRGTQNSRSKATISNVAAYHVDLSAVDSSSSAK